jgi:FKBP-type peptidyl-prolyl cis-trans isomerase FkpA
MRNRLLFSLVMLIFLCPSCSRRQENVVTETDIRETEEALIGANRLMIRNDREKILAYIKQHNLRLEESPSGLWYAITKSGSGEKVKTNWMVTLNYSVSLLDGTACYNSDSLGAKHFLVGQGGVEGVLMLNEGSNAIFILPPHLAYGFPGDGNKIPARSIIVYHIELLKVEP